jgi:hypothetical protein
MRALHGSCLLPSPVCICKGVEDGLCSAQQAGTLNLAKSRYEEEKTHRNSTNNMEDGFQAIHWKRYAGSPPL